MNHERYIDFLKKNLGIFSGNLGIALISGLPWVKIQISNFSSPRGIPVGISRCVASETWKVVDFHLPFKWRYNKKPYGYSGMDTAVWIRETHPTACKKLLQEDEFSRS